MSFQYITAIEAAEITKKATTGILALMNAISEAAYKGKKEVFLCEPEDDACTVWRRLYDYTDANIEELKKLGYKIELIVSDYGGKSSHRISW